MIYTYENLFVAYFSINGRFCLVSLKNPAFSNIFPRAKHVSDDFWILNAMCMFIYLFVVYFSFAPVISTITGHCWGCWSDHVIDYVMVYVINVYFVWNHSLHTVDVLFECPVCLYWFEYVDSLIRITRMWNCVPTSDAFKDWSS